MTSSLRLTCTAAELIQRARDNPRVPIIEGLLYETDLALLHAPEESFKSFFILQLAMNLASEEPFLRRWEIATPQRVGIVNTEMDAVGLGERLQKMAAAEVDRLGDLRFLDRNGLKEFRRCGGLGERVKFVRDWATEEKVEFLIIDTANDFFRGKENPNDETVVGRFFEGVRGMPCRGYLLVRHDHKPKMEDAQGSSNDRIRGSAEWKEDPELILNLQRQDKRTHEVLLEVGKQRYGRKAEPLTLWFDADAFRLTALPPVIHILEKGPQARQEVIEAARRRFSLGQRATDDQLAKYREFLSEDRVKHEKRFKIRWDAVTPGDMDEDVEPWRRLLVMPDRVRDTQDCISTSPSLVEATQLSA